MQDEFDENDPWHLPLLCAFGASVAVNWFYSLSRCKNIFSSIASTRCYTDSPKKTSGMLKQGKEPYVTIQISTFNEGDVAIATINHACSVDWPRDKLEIHVCDDSTDQHSINTILKMVASWQEKGIKISRKARSDRVGYKAGCLRYHFGSIEGDFVAHMDADHRMERDFLRKTIPHFFDSEGNEKLEIGLVQAPWGYYNLDITNLLTCADSISLDIHHVIEQTGRAAAYGTFGFNGTGGVWRTSAIRDAGGWTWESITEDLSLSYKAYQKGYRFLYVRDIPQMLELPENFKAYIQQQHRWTKGYLQVFRYNYLEILLSKDVPLIAKWEIFCHVTGPMQYVAFLVGFIIYPWLVLHRIDGPYIRYAAVTNMVEPVVSALIACFGKHPSRRKREFRNPITKSMRIIHILPHFALKAGISLFQFLAISEGLFSKDATFLTTPKKGSANSVVHIWIHDIIAWIGVLLAVHRIVFLATFDAFYDSCLYNNFFIAINLLSCFGLFWVNLGFLDDKYKMNDTLKRTIFGRTKERQNYARVGVLMMLTLSCFGMYQFASPPQQAVIPKQGVYFMANDKVLDHTIAFLNSFRKFNPTIPLALLPFNESDCETLYGLASKYDFEVFYEPNLFKQLDDLSREYFVPGISAPVNPQYRKLAIWDGPFDEFLYLDIDAVVLDSVDFAFPLLKYADVMTSSSDQPEMKRFVWKDSIDDSGLLSPRQIAYSANTGSILSSKRYASTNDIVEKSRNIAPKLVDHLSHGSGFSDQGILNYYFVTSGRHYTSLSNLAFNRAERVLDEVKLEYFGQNPLDEKNYLTDDKRIGKTTDRHHGWFFLHWPGHINKCSKNANSELNTCEIWRYWRNFDEISVEPKV